MSLPLIHLIDPTSADIQALQTRLEMRGYRCSLHRSWEECAVAALGDGATCVIAPIQDLPMEQGKPLPAFRQLASVVPAIVLAHSIEVETAVSLMENGAATVLVHPVDHQRLLQVLEREIQIRKRRPVDEVRRRTAIECWATLDADERQIVQLLVAGKTTKAIASQLSLSTRTIDRRRRTVLEKMEVKSLSELAVLVGLLGELD